MRPCLRLGEHIRLDVFASTNALLRPTKWLATPLNVEIICYLHAFRSNVMTVIANSVRHIQVLACHLPARQHAGNSEYLVAVVSSGREADQILEM